MAIPIDSYFWVQPTDITNMTLWQNGSTIYLSPQSVYDGYLEVLYSTQSSADATLKVPGYYDATVSIGDGVHPYITLTPLPANLYAWVDSNTTLYAWTNPNTNVTCYTTTSTPSTNSPLVLYDKNGDIFNYNHGDLINGISAADSNSITIETES